RLWWRRTLMLLSETMIAEQPFVASDQPHGSDFADPERLVDTAHCLIAAPSIALPSDRKQIVGRGWMAAVRQRGGRRHADYRNRRSAGPLDPHRGMDVVMPVQYQFHAMTLQGCDQLR